tara:strand:+ start:1378 stop:2418 length:1041 start_codon:yes stop_codon:yes gene_type:complete
MATTAIADEIEALTGVGTADASFLVSAQKFVVSSVPKTLLKWASSLTNPSSHGGNTSQGTSVVVPIGTDKILSVSRNGFSAEEVPYNMKGFIANSASLHLSTNTYPKYYFDNAVTDKGVVVIVKPAPTDSETVRVLYVDHTKIDDDSDLRNAVIYRACSSEFGKLSSAQNDDFETAIGLVFAAIAQASIAANKFASSTSDSVYDTNATWDATNSQLTRVKDAMDKVVLLIDGNKPTSGYDAHDLLQAEDIELLNGNLSIVKSELERAQVHISEWVSVGDMRVKEVNVALSEAQGSLGEINGRLAQRQAYAAESVKYYNWANQELQTYIGTNEKTIQYQSQQQTQAQ